MSGISTARTTSDIAIFYQEGGGLFCFQQIDSNTQFNLLGRFLHWVKVNSFVRSAFFPTLSTYSRGNSAIKAASIQK